ncbi:MAG: methylmalonyl-CoA mutase family protein [Dehalococcoidia bacterium]
MESGNDDFKTLSGIPLKRVYRPEDAAGLDYGRDLGDPGQAPFTRGPYPNGYRERLWRIFQLTGYGTPEDARERILYALNHGETGFIMEIDQLTSYHMFDADHPDVVARHQDVGLCGPPLQSLQDYELILEGIPIEETYCHPGGAIPQFSPFAHSCYFSVAQKRGIPLSQLRGTGEGDFLLSYLSCPIKDQVTPQGGMRLNCDLIEFCAANVPKWVPVSIPGYNARESGITAAQEVAIVLANAIDYIEELLRRGRLQIDDFASGIGGVNFSCGRDFFEDIAKMRAARRMWCKLLSERYGAKDPRSLRMRIHVVTAASNLTYQQPLNNIVRTTCYALASALAGVQSLGVSSYDEAISIPSPEAQLLAIRTQQVLQYESNIPAVVDPLGGSYFVESLTSEVEQRAWDYLGQIEKQGGFIQALDSGWLHREIMKAMTEWEMKVNREELKLVGVNCFQMEEEPHQVKAFRSNPKAWEISRDRVQRLRQERDNGKTQAALERLRTACQGEENIIPVLMEAVQAYATAGEVGDVFREVFGIWKTPLPV